MARSLSIIFVAAAVLVLVSVSVGLVSVSVRDHVSNTIKLDTSADREFRGVWVATVANIDWPSSSHATSAQQQAELVALFDQLKELNFNAIIFQVRPVADAFYSSSYDPWSVYLTGQQGREPSPYWDPLATAVAEAHKRGMELHAWFNPYRARAGSSSRSGLAAKHIANQLHQYAYAYGSNLWMDPGAQAVKNRTLDTIMDVVNRYDVDGVHFDDYFYPYPVAGQAFPDTATYNAYVSNGGHLSRDLWRHQNVDSLIQALSQRIKSSRPWVKFGLSPFGIWMSGHPHGVVGFSSNTQQYADSRKWLQEGWVDYLSPQLYWKIDPPQQSFTALSDWWIQQNTRGRHLYTGVATYRIADSHSWPISEIQRQVTETRLRRSQNDLGNIFFSAKYYRSNSHGISDLFKSLNARPALAPSMQWLHSDVSHIATPTVSVGSGTISWTADSTDRLRAYALYRRDEATSQYRLQQLLGRDTLSVKVGPGTYALTAVDRLANESQARVVIVDTPLVG
ncbi:glycosyl hydrolase YngK-like [Littorina saxatilis]|uniref:Glycosyl hydrolase-like 10 domain-containing protein n=1 Tax=Littorina saxatilis TaxID=31220 RepID=A0AAN9B605_9CAEN